MSIHPDILAYNESQSSEFQQICAVLAETIDRSLSKAGSECKIWHRHPVWFLDGNPIVGFSTLKSPKPTGCVRLLFWSGQSFDEPGLRPEGTFKAAEARYINVDEIIARDLDTWLKKSIEIQWDYKNIVKRKGKLVRLK